MIKAKRVLIIQKNLSNVTDHFLRKTSLQCSCLFILYEFWSVTVTETQVKICPSPVQPRENIQVPIPTSEKISLHLSRSLQIPGQMRPFLWRATRGHSSSGDTIPPFTVAWLWNFTGDGRNGGHSILPPLSSVTHQPEEAGMWLLHGEREKMWSVEHWLSICWLCWEHYFRD